MLAEWRHVSRSVTILSAQAKAASKHVVLLEVDLADGMPLMLQSTTKQARGWLEDREELECA